MEQMHRCNDREHIIVVKTTDDASSSSSHDEQPQGMALPQHEVIPPTSTGVSSYHSSSSSNRLNTRNSFMRRDDGYGRRHRSPLNSGMWISVELIVTVSQIIASIVVLSLSGNENPQAPLFAWVFGYASGCVATLPILYWRFCNRHQGMYQDSTQSRQGSSLANPPEQTSLYTAISVNQASDEENNRSTETETGNTENAVNFCSRLNGLVDHFKMALDCFFAVWFVVGNVWIFGGHSSPSDAPNLYRGATAETINALPAYKFKSKKSGDVNDQDNSGTIEGGVLASGTEKERMISGEDAVCCICLAKYVDNDELRELSCSHLFHLQCVDKWLKINASCPLCKSEIGDSSSP